MSWLNNYWISKYKLKEYWRNINCDICILAICDTYATNESMTTTRSKRVNASKMRLSVNRGCRFQISSQNFYIENIFIHIHCSKFNTLEWHNIRRRKIFAKTFFKYKFVAWKLITRTSRWVITSNFLHQYFPKYHPGEPTRSRKLFIEI